MQMQCVRSLYFHSFLFELEDTHENKENYKGYTEEMAACEGTDAMGSVFGLFSFIGFLTIKRSGAEAVCPLSEFVETHEYKENKCN